jgi:hypothetical protein
VTAVPEAGLAKYPLLTGCSSLCRKDLVVLSPDRPVLITDAPESPAQQRADRTRRYSLLMGGRLVLFVLAGLAYPLSPWLAVALLALSIPLPWMAVLIANDAPPRGRRRTADSRRLPPPAPSRALEARSHVVVDADPLVRDELNRRTG